MRAWSLARGNPRRLFTSLAPLRKTPTGGLLFPAGEEILSVDLELKAIVEPDLTFRATMTSQTTGRRGGLGGLFCLRALQRDGGFRAALLLSGGINDGVAESHRCVATSRGPPTSPRAAPQCAGFFLAQGAALRPQRAPRSFATHASLGSLAQRSPRTARAVQRREADGGARRPAAARLTKN